MTAADHTVATPDKAASAFGQGFVTDAWYYVALSRHVGFGALRRFEIMGQPLVLGRTREGAVYGLRDICPHRAVPLSAGKLVEREGEGETIECPYHGWRFRTDGVCAAIPSLADDQEMEIERIKVRKYHLRESQGMIFVWMPSSGHLNDEPSHEPPLFDGADGDVRIYEWMDFDSHIDHAVVGLMDPAHGPYVHKQWWWRTASSMHEKAKAFAPREYGWAMVRHQPSSNSRLYKLLGGAPETEITFRLPGYRWEHIQVGSKYVLALTLLTPINDTRTRITQIFWSDHAVFGLVRPFLKAGVVAFLQQDGSMVELQNEGLKHNPAFIWIDGADTQAKWYRKLKQEWQVARAEGRTFVNPLKETVLRWKS